MSDINISFMSDMTLRITLSKLIGESVYGMEVFTCLFTLSFVSFTFKILGNDVFIFGWLLVYNDKCISLFHL